MGGTAEAKPTRGWASRTGKEEDVEVGLYYFGKRYLNPLLGRWVSADPLAVHALKADPNLYAYVTGQLLKNVDPLGLEGWSGPDEVAQGENYAGEQPNPSPGEVAPTPSSGSDVVVMPLDHVYGSPQAEPSVGTEAIRMAGGAYALRPPSAPAGVPPALAQHVEEGNQSGAGASAEFTTRVGAVGAGVAGLGSAGAALAPGVSAAGGEAAISVAARYPWVPPVVWGATNAVTEGGAGIRGNEGAASRVLHVSQLDSLPEAAPGTSTVVLGPFSRTVNISLPNGPRISGVEDTWETVLHPAAAQLGGTTLKGLPGRIEVLAPVIRKADRIVFFTTYRLGPLTQAEMNLVQSSPTLMERTTFVYGGIK